MIIQKQQKPVFSVRINCYHNRFSNKKASSKNEGLLEVYAQRLQISQLRPKQSDKFQKLDIIYIYDINHIVSLYSQSYIIWKIVFNKINDDRINDDNLTTTLRIFDLAVEKQVQKFITARTQQIKSLPNYISLQQKQKTIIRSILLKQQQYNQICKKLQHCLKLSTLQTCQLQKTLLQSHPLLKSFYLLQHCLKFQQQKNILVQRLKINQYDTNINRQKLVKDLEQEAKGQKLEGYSRKKEFQGVNFYLNDQQTHIISYAENIDTKRENLILKNISIHPNITQNNYFQDFSKDFNHNQSSKSKFQKMEIQQGQIQDFKGSDNKMKLRCKKMKIPQSKDIRLQQKRDQVNRFDRNEVKFVDPSYNPQKQRKITKKAIIWCRLFYIYLRQGMKRQKQLSIIQQQVKLLKNSAQINKSTIKMIQKLCSNFLQLKRNQQLY